MSESNNTTKRKIPSGKTHVCRTGKNRFGPAKASDGKTGAGPCSSARGSEGVDRRGNRAHFFIASCTKFVLCLWRASECHKERT